MLRGLSLLALLLAAACTSTTNTPPSGSSPAAANAAVSELPANELPAGPSAIEDPRDRRQRLLRLEHACDQWYAAWLQQEFGRMASLEILLREATNKDFSAVLSDLAEGSPRHKRVMSAALGFSGRSEAIPALQAALQEQYFEIVLHALLSMYRLCDPELGEAAKASVAAIDVERVVTYLTHPKAEVRSNAALVLSRVASPQMAKPALLALMALADDSEARVRLHAIAALSAARAPETYPQLVKGLSDAMELVRIRAALGLARLGNRAAAPYIVELLAKPEEALPVKQAAMRALGVLLGCPADRSMDPAHWRMLLDAGK